jgi:hypothetical protein
MRGGAGVGFALSKFWGRTPVITFHLLILLSQEGRRFLGGLVSRQEFATFFPRKPPADFLAGGFRLPLCW